MSDPHLGDVSPDQILDDEKAVFGAQPDLETTQRVFRRTLQLLAKFVEKHGKPEVAVCSGDLTYMADRGGLDAFYDLLRERKDILPQYSRIAVVPGNHDVVWDEEPGTRARYAGFLRATRRCCIPLLDGVDFDAETGALLPESESRAHVVETDHTFVVPLNSSNYCGVLAHVRDTLPESEWRRELAPLGAEGERLLSELRRLNRHDIPRVSRAQIEALGAYFERAGLVRERAGDDRLRVAVLHHQLLPVSTREERKPFESLVNLGLVRETLRDFGFDLVLHGHKHESGVYWDIAAAGGLDAPVRQVLVISSPGHFVVGSPVMRAIVLEGSSRARNLRIVTFSGASSNQRRAREAEQRVPLWTAEQESEPSERTTVAAPTAHTAYAKLRAMFELRDSRQLRNLVCRVDDPTDAHELPPDFPEVGLEDPQQWLDGLVDWWQRDRSELLARDPKLFNHGERIYRRWGDQIDRAIRMLNARADSSRALVQLIDPAETGRRIDDRRDLHRGSFPAFALAEFAVTERNHKRYLDCFGYFRKQEMQYWWPVNVAELALLQEKVRAGLRPTASTGRIVTLSAIALWKGVLPRVAVPDVDLLVEEPNRLWDMAAAVAFPGAAGAQAVADWHRVLRDLAGAGRDGPPKVSVGIAILCEDAQRLLGLGHGAAGLKAVAAALEDLRDDYAAHADREQLPSAAAEVVRKRVAKLTAAVGKVLPKAIA